MNGSGGSGSGGSTAKDGGMDVPMADTHPGTGGVKAGSGGASGSGGTSGNGCDTLPGLVWHTGNKTNFESYPAQGSEECIQNSGCDYEGQFAGCNDTKLESWVMAHNIVSVFPDFSDPSDGAKPAPGHSDLRGHDLCIKSGSHVLRVSAIDTCRDSDCDGCCTQNLGSAYDLIDVEKYTDQRFGVDDGPIQFADLGPNGGACN
ncbi:MAG TPA: hypothetical protein VH374_10495 [Polyangia bacterium]|nr:hypothetical protein [Polyangia bacterium]